MPYKVGSIKYVVCMNIGHNMLCERGSDAHMRAPLYDYYYWVTELRAASHFGCVSFDTRLFPVK